jgi:flagellar hook-length control protein FliK
VTTSGAEPDTSASTLAATTPTVSDSVAQALAGLVHQLLAKDSRTEAAPALSTAGTTNTADAGATTLVTLSGASVTAARTAVAVSLAQAVLAKSALDSDSSTDADNALGPADASGQGAASAAALAVASAAQAPVVAAIPERVITVPVQSSQWPQALGTEIRWLTSQNIQSAVLRLSPEHLGPVQVNISVNASHVSVSFGAAHPDTRAALEQAMPRLRDMLSGAGLTLGEATVQQQSRQASQNSNPAARSLLGGADTDAQPASAVTWRSGLVDEYA